MGSPRRGWWLAGAAGVVTGAAGLAVSLLASAAMGIRINPVVGIGEAIIELTPGSLAERAIQAVGQWDKPLLVSGVLVGLVLLSFLAGVLALRSTAWPQVVFVLLAAIGAAAVLTRPQARPTDVLPVVLGGLVWIALAGWVLGRLAPPGVAADSRRDFLRLVGWVAAGSVAIGLLGRIVGRGRARVEAERAGLSLPISRTAAPPGSEVGVAGVEPWVTPNTDFYRIDTALVVPSVAAGDWSLRIHGMVERELTLTFDDLLARGLTEQWTTLNCVSNTVGGDLIGNAWWSGVRLAGLLAEARPLRGADAVKQTSHDGWTCGTPLAALTDRKRGAMLAVGMNGEPLPLEHGFPVRTLVPGLYGFVSACKWVVDMEVTRFADFDAYWSTRGWSEQAPVKLASRIDAPESGDKVAAGTLRIGGSAWQQYVGIAAVDFQLDGGAWQPATLGRVPGNSTWVQWAGSVEVAPGDHVLVVRATSADGEVQTAVRARPAPDGATGWHTVSFTAR